MIITFGTSVTTRAIVIVLTRLGVLLSTSKTNSLLDNLFSWLKNNVKRSSNLYETTGISGEIVGN